MSLPKKDCPLIIPSGSEVGDLKTAAVAEEEVPASIAGLSSKSEEYTHSEIFNILTGSEWVIPDELGSL